MEVKDIIHKNLADLLKKGVLTNRSLRKLRHLILHGKLANPRKFPKLFRTLRSCLPKYQNLSTLTFVAMQGFYTPTMPEKDSAIDPKGLSDEGVGSDMSFFAEEIVSREDFVESIYQRCGGSWNFPMVKIRDEKQLREAIGDTTGWQGRWQ